jgi:hypothetical protein
MRRDYVIVSERGVNIRRQPGRQDTDSNKEIEYAIDMLDKELFSMGEFLLRIAARSSEHVDQDFDDVRFLAKIYFIFAR